MDTTRAIVLPLLFVMLGRPDYGAFFLGLGLADLIWHVVADLIQA